MFWDVPKPITAWMQLNGVYSMYPCDGVKPASGILADWECHNCPWYMEYQGWNRFESNAIANAAKVLIEGGDPPNLYNISQLAPIHESIKDALKVEAMIPMDVHFDGKKTRKDADKGQADVGNQSQRETPPGIYFPA